MEKHFNLLFLYVQTHFQLINKYTQKTICDLFTKTAHRVDLFLCTWRSMDEM